jgi:hypothetical protein
MKYLIKIMGLCLMAVALSAVVVASASAASEPLLVKKGGGAIVKKKFTGTSKAKLFTLETKANGNFECTSLSARGEVTSSTAAESTVTFTGCKALSFLNCKTAGAKGASEIILRLSIRPRWLVGGIGSKVGLLMSILPIGSTITITCTGGQTLKVRGSFIVPAGKVKEPHKLLILKAQETKGVQAPIEYETAEGVKIKNTLEMEGSGTKVFAFEQLGEEIEEEATFEEEVEFV